jgi:hypothetical protein
VEAAHKTLVNIGRNECPGRRQVNSEVKRIFYFVYNILIIGSLPKIKGLVLIFGHLCKLHKALIISNLRPCTIAPQGWFTMW